MATPRRTVPSTSGASLTESIELTKRFKLPLIRRSLTAIIPAPKAQRWDRAEVVRDLLAEEAAGCHRANLHTHRKRAGFPSGKTFGDWHENKSSVPRATQDALKRREWVDRRENFCICGPQENGEITLLRGSRADHGRPA